MQKRITIALLVFLLHHTKEAWGLTGVAQVYQPVKISGLTGVQPNFVQEVQSDHNPMIQPGVCSLGNTLRCKNDGKSIGMFDVAVKGDWFNWNSSTPSPTVKFGSSIKIVNKADPKKVLYLGYVSGNRQSQVFRGSGELECYLCHGSGAQDPNQRANPCIDPHDENYCVICSPTQIPCDQVLTIQRAQASGAEDRAQDANSIINRLGLTGTMIPVVNK